jgi:hypothetical protein
MYHYKDYVPATQVVLDFNTVHYWNNEINQELPVDRRGPVTANRERSLAEIEL